MLNNHRSVIQFAFAFIALIVLAAASIGLDVTSASAQIDPTAQQQTVEAMIAEIFAATQTAQTDILTPTPTATPTPGMLTIAIQVPYPARVSVEELRALLQDVVDNALARLPTTQPGSGDVLPSPAVISVTEPTPIPPPVTEFRMPTRWEYLVIIEYEYRESQLSERIHYFDIETTAHISESLRTLILNIQPGIGNFYHLFSAAGAEGWELMPSVLWGGFDVDQQEEFEFPRTSGSAIFVFKRPVT